jgi:hypothetical protein
MKHLAKARGLRLKKYGTVVIFLLNVMSWGLFMAMING